MTYYKRKDKPATLVEAYLAARKGRFYPWERAQDALRDARAALQPPAEDVLPAYPGGRGHREFNLVERGGLWFRVELQYDEDSGPPWEQGEEGTMRSIRGKEEVGGGEYLIAGGRSYDMWAWTPPEDMDLTQLAYELRDYHGYSLAAAYDWARERIEKQRSYLEDWINDQWCYVGLIVTAYETEEDAEEDCNEIENESCWGYDYGIDDTYLNEEANSRIDSMVATYTKQQEEAQHQEKVANRFHDAMECGI